MIVAALVIFLLYTFLVLYFTRGIQRLKTLMPDLVAPRSEFSILVPLRNEEQHLPHILKSLAALDYPADKFELILINDASTDASETVIKKFTAQHPGLNINLINNSGQVRSPKKAAITNGISNAAFEWILTTDADCIVPPKWLRTFDMMIRKENVKMMVAPVSYLNRAGLLHKFQLLDFLSLQGTTMGSFGMKDQGPGKPFLCNGANLCYLKESFYQVNGFEGNEHIASGDDVFLMEKMLRKFPDEVQFVKSKEAIVRTSSKDSFKELVQQRVRWAAKTGAFDSLFAKIVGLLVFGTSLLMVLLIIFAIFDRISWMYTGLFFLLKFNIDFILLYKTSQFFDEEGPMKSYFISSLLHPFFTILIVCLSFGRSYSWKGRTYP